MHITVKTAPKAKSVSVTAEPGTPISDLISRFRRELPYDVVAARLDNHVVGLDTWLSSLAATTS